MRLLLYVIFKLKHLKKISFKFTRPLLRVNECRENVDENLSKFALLQAFFELSRLRDYRP